MIRLVTGGARSGKSNYAEAIYEDREDVVYLATARISDREMEERVEAHKSSRPDYWRTFECTYHLEIAVGEEKHYLLDCVTVLTSNIMFDLSKDSEYIDYQLQEKIENTVVDEIERLISAVRERGFQLTMVTNELGYSIVPEDHVSRVFRDIQGRVNQRIAAISDQVYFLACGIPVQIK